MAVSSPVATKPGKRNHDSKQKRDWNNDRQKWHNDVKERKQDILNCQPKSNQNVGQPDQLGNHNHGTENHKGGQKLRNNFSDKIPVSENDCFPPWTSAVTDITAT